MERGFYRMLVLAIGLILDGILGDPQRIWHPVQGMGAWIHLCEKVFRKLLPKTKQGEWTAGAVTVLSTLAVATLVPLLLLRWAYAWQLWFGVLLEGFLCYTMFAAKSLQKESMKVYDALEYSGLEEARTAVSMIVGRDTEKLSEEGVIKATVETIAENTSDGVIAPLLFAAIGGAPFAYFYKAVNTMDSMIGYKNEKYRYYGRVAARLDDVLNWIPARCSAFCMIAASGVLGRNHRKAYEIWKRDRRNHASPNSAQTEAVMAGALGVCLAGNASYFGEMVEKPTIGDEDRMVERADICKACRLMWMTMFLFVLLVYGVFIGIAVVLSWG